MTGSDQLCFIIWASSFFVLHNIVHLFFRKVDRQLTINVCYSGFSSLCSYQQIFCFCFSWGYVCVSFTCFKAFFFFFFLAYSKGVFFWLIQVLYGEGNGNPLQYSCLGNPMDRGAQQAAVHGVARSRTRLSDFTFTFHFHALEEDGNPLQYSCLYSSQGWGSLVGCRLWCRTESDTIEATQQQQQVLYICPVLYINSIVHIGMHFSNTEIVEHCFICLLASESLLLTVFMSVLLFFICLRSSLCSLDMKYFISCICCKYNVCDSDMTERLN